MKNCNFCLENKQIKGTILLQNEQCYLVESIDSVLQAAGMIIPHRHVNTLFELTSAEWQGVKELLHAAKVLYEAQYSPDGFNIGWNIGEVAG